MTFHKPVMPSECLAEVSRFSGDPVLIDCNLGEGGHSAFFLENSPSLRIVGVDRDSSIVEVAKARLAGFSGRVSFINAWADEYLSAREKNSADCVMFDFGVSMFHFKSSGRGFSFMNDEPLDMRLDAGQRLSAYDVVNGYDVGSLRDIFFRYGEERKSGKIADALARARRESPIRTTFRLKEVIDSCFSPAERRKSRIEPATKCFQAVRIEVNDELGRIERSLKAAFEVIRPGGSLIAISFHSLEDRIVKWMFRGMEKDGKVSVLTKRPAVSSAEEIDANPASRGAKLRIARRIV